MEVMTVDQQNYKAYVADRIEAGWTASDVSEYRAAVKEIMTTGTDDEKAAAREFWALMADAAGQGINERIRASIATEKANERKSA